MTKREVAEMITVLQANYPDSFRDLSDDGFGARIDLWYDFFGEYPKEIVYAAAKSFMATDTKGFMPTVGQINDHINRMKHTEEMTPAEAWALVHKAICNSAWNATESFAKLPPECQRAVGSPQQLKEWALMEADVVQSVVASNFQKSFLMRQNRNKDFEKLPRGVKTFVARIAGTAFGYLDAGETGEEVPDESTYI